MVVGGTVGVAATAVALIVLGGCTPEVAQDAPAEAMEFDFDVVPPRVPQPTGLIFNPQSKHLDFSLADVVLPADCADAVPPLSQAECEFDKYLQTLDGFPSVTPAAAPATAPLASESLTVGANVVVVAAKSQTVVTDVTVGFDATSRSLTVRPRRSWSLGESYFIGVRGYDNGVRAANGRQVVGSPTQYLLKQTMPLTCAGTSDCPALTLLLQTHDREKATQSLFQLEEIRQAYQPAWTLMEQVGGLSRAETAVLWSFPVHSASVIELDPTVPALLPRTTAPDEIRVAVQGTVDPTTIKPYISAIQFGSVVFMDLTAAQAMDGPGSFPTVAATVSGQDIVIKGAAPFIPGHQYGLFITDEVRDVAGAPLVASPVSVLLRLRSRLTSDGRSTISSVSDGDANQLEVGRAQLAMLFDDRNFAIATKVTRERLIYCFAFPFGGTP